MVTPPTNPHTFYKKWFCDDKTHALCMIHHFTCVRAFLDTIAEEYRPLWESNPRPWGYKPKPSTIRANDRLWDVWVLLDSREYVSHYMYVRTCIKITITVGFEPTTLGLQAQALDHSGKQSLTDFRNLLISATRITLHVRICACISMKSSIRITENAWMHKKWIHERWC